MNDLAVKNLDGVALISAFETLLAGAVQDELSLDLKRTAIGLYLDKIRSTQAWKEAGWDSYGKFVAAMGEKCKRGRTSLYGWAGVARDLAQQIPAETLAEIDMSKAKVLALTAKAIGKPLAPEIVEAAAKPETGEQDIRKMAADLYHVQEPPRENMTWYDTGGFYVTKEERATLEQADELAAAQDPPIQEGGSKQKEIRLRMAEECISTWRPQAEDADFTMGEE